MQDLKIVPMLFPDTVETVLPIWQSVWDAAQEAQQADVEALWPEFIQTPPHSIRFFFQVFRWLSNRSKTSEEVQQNLIVMLLQNLQEQHDFSFMYDMVKFAVGRWPDSKKFGALAAGALMGRFGDQPWFRSVARALSGVDLPTGFKRFESLLRLTPGQVWRHHELKDGIVSEFSLEAKKVKIDFADEKGKTFTFEGATKFLKHFPEDHIVAMRATKPVELGELAQDNPQAVIRMTLHGHGGRMTQGSVKEFLYGSVIADSKWNRWWEKARIAIRLDPHIDFEGRGGAHAMLIWRERPRTLTDEIQSAFFGEDVSVAQRVDAVCELCSRIEKGDNVEPALLERMANETIVFLDDPDVLLMEQIQMAMVLEDLVQLGAPVAIPEENRSSVLLGKVSGDYALLADMENVDYAVKALAFLFERDGDNGRDCACRLLSKASRKLAQAIWKELDRETHVMGAVDAIQDLLANPMSNVDTYLWAVRGILTGDWDHLSDYIPPSRLVPELVDLLSEWCVIAEQPSGEKEVVENAKKLVATVRQLLQARGKVDGVEKDFAPLRLAVLDLPEEQILTLRGSVDACLAFNGVFRNGASRAMLQAIERGGKAKGTGATAPVVTAAQAAQAASDTIWHWCTKPGYDKSYDRLSYLQNDAIPQNAKEIETARAEGDLKENAGYHAARERHGLLMDEANMLSEALGNARVFNIAELTTDKIGFGVKFAAQNMQTGNTENYIVLGRFESDVEHGIISYQTPFMRQFLGATVGDDVQTTEGGTNKMITYKITEISSAF